MDQRDFKERLSQTLTLTFDYPIAESREIVELIIEVYPEVFKFTKPKKQLKPESFYLDVPDKPSRLKS